MKNLRILMISILLIDSIESIVKEVTDGGSSVSYSPLTVSNRCPVLDNNRYTECRVAYTTLTSKGFNGRGGYIAVDLNGFYNVSMVVFWPSASNPQLSRGISVYTSRTDSELNQRLFRSFDPSVVSRDAYEAEAGTKRTWARYVTLYKDSVEGEDMAVSEVLVYTDYEYVGMLLSQSVVATENHVHQNDDDTYSASMALDGLLATCAFTAQETVSYRNIPGWWKVDIKSSTTVSGISVTNSDAPYIHVYSYLDHVSIFVHENEESTAADLCLNYDEEVQRGSNEPVDLLCTRDMRGRYLTVKKVSHFRIDALAICELIVLVRYNLGTITTTTTLPPVTLPPYTGSLRPALKMSSNFRGVSLDLDLSINPDIPEKLPISTGDFTMRSLSFTGVYNDNKNKVSLVVNYGPSNMTENPQPVMGTFIKGEELYTLFPANSKSYSNITIENSNFTTVKENLKDIISLCNIKGDPNQFLKSFYPKRRKRQSSINSKEYTIELLILSDYSTYLKYTPLRCLNENDLSGCHFETQITIQNYIFLLVNLVSMRYFSIISNKYTVRVKPVNIIIHESPRLIKYIENSNVVQTDSQGNKIIKANEVLKRFALELNKDEHLIKYNKSYDHATIITNYKIFIDDPETKNEFTGYTMFSGMCNFGNFDDINADKPQSVSLVRNKGLFSAVAALAHQLAHSMRINHDEEANECLAKDQYIMAPFINQLSPSNADHINYFSKCTAQYLEQYFEYQTEDFCMTKVNWNVQINDTFPAEYSLDDYCFLVFGTGSKFCQGSHQDICYHMECWNPQVNACVKSDDVRAFNGMTCGPNRKCEQSKCQYTGGGQDPNLSKCNYKDYIGNFKSRSTSDDNFNCQKLSSSIAFAFACYEEDVTLRCCNYCNETKNNLNLNIGCEYGNKDPAYCGQAIIKELNYRCYDDAYETKCCANCQKQTVIPNCKYGDKETWCNDYVTFENCNSDTDVSLKNICCHSCYFVTQKTTPRTSTSTTTKIETTHPANSCPNGDIWGNYCTNYADDRVCKISFILANCCETCATLV